MPSTTCLVLLFFVIAVTVAINAQDVQRDLQLDYLFPSMIFEPASKLTPPYKVGTYSYSFSFPLSSKPYGFNVAFYLFAGPPRRETAEIVINQDGHFFQILTSKQYWQSNKVPIPLTMNETTIDLHILDGEKVGPTYTIHVTRAAA